MGFGIIRVRNLQSGDVAGAQEHNKREYTPERMPDNINPEEEGYYGSNQYYTKNNEKSILKAIERLLSENNIKPRKNSVVALEYVVALSPDAKEKVYKTKYNASAMLDHLCRFIEKKHGKENVVSVDYHFDESNPHAHVIVVPIVEKEVRYKNKYGDYTAKKKRLCARDFTGGKEKLRQLQTDFYEHTKKIMEVKRLDYPIYRGVDARKNKKAYIRETIRALAEPREQLLKAQELQQEISEKRVTSEKKAKETFERFDPWKDEKKPKIKLKNKGMGMKKI
jgi:hypothetical protein